MLLLSLIGSAVAKPNIIMALGDDTGWHGVGWHQSAGCQADTDCAMLTPHMDGLVRNGVELDQHYTYRFCSPTRSAAMTGRLPIHVNQQNSAEYPWTAAAMHPSFRTVADVLREKADYATHQLGKWHLGLASQAFTPAGRGFDTSVGYLSGSEEHFTHAKGMEACKTGLPFNCTGKCATDFWHTDSPATGFDGVYSSNVYAGEMVKIIHAAADDADAKPFFVYLAFANTHEPLEAPQSFQDLYPQTMQPKSRMLLGAMVSSMDEAMANITQALKATKQWNNTLIVWVSDNGGPTGVGQVGAKANSCSANNYPLRGGKGSAFQVLLLIDCAFNRLYPTWTRCY
jgi:arylsulfatase A-like enzyme